MRALSNEYNTEDSCAKESNPLTSSSCSVLSQEQAYSVVLEPFGKSTNIRKSYDPFHRRIIISSRQHEKEACHRGNKTKSKYLRRSGGNLSSFSFHNIHPERLHKKPSMNPFMMSLFICLSFYMMITLSSDIAIFYQAPEFEKEKNTASFGVEHGREVHFLPKTLEAEKVEQAHSTTQVSHMKKVERIELRKKGKEKKLRRPVLSNIRTPQEDAVPIFYPSESILQDLQLENDWDFHFTMNEVRKMELTFANFNIEFDIIIGILIGILFSMMFLLCCPCEVLKQLERFGLRSRAIENHQHRSR